ncbi:MAG TPA: Rieske 2Fe-2S domain-containing protein [Burkholderiaceae bacterium]|jgi:toluene monooxygenase system ferredoxin subunit|nr:Rieske 2Fe-2S domain-containing protein [Burkholderiaceae bacterium]
MKKIHICKAEDIPANGMKSYDIDDGTKVLVANAGECYYAYQGLCPHQDVCLDEGYFDGSTLTCHQHLWQWDITTGDAIGLAEAPLERYDIDVQDGDIFLVRSEAMSSNDG